MERKLLLQKLVGFKVVHNSTPVTTEKEFESYLKKKQFPTNINIKKTSPGHEELFNYLLSVENVIKAITFYVENETEINYLVRFLQHNKGVRILTKENLNRLFETKQ